MKKLMIFWLIASVGWQTAVPTRIDYEGALLISEVGYDTPGNDAVEEWIELVNVADVALPLDGVRLGDEEKSGGNEGMLRFPEGAIIEAGQVIIVAQTALSFRALFGLNPTFEIVESDAAVPNMRPSRLWATGDLALGNDGDEVLLLHDGRIIDAINYEERTTFFVPSIGAALTGQSIVRLPTNCDSDSAADWETAVIPTPFTISLEPTCQPPLNPALLEELPAIGVIQGEGAQSPFVNQTVTFRGVMTGHHADTNAAGVTFHTIFVQELIGFEDGNEQTSDGIAVFLGRERPSTQIGDQLRITGQVTEFFGLTEIDDDALEIWVEAEGVPLPPPKLLSNWHEAEAVEGMRVMLDEAVVVGPTFAGCGLFVNQLGAKWAFQRSSEEGVGERPFPLLNHTESPCDSLAMLSSGDELSHLVGPLTYHFDQYKLVLQPDVSFQIAPRPLSPPQAVRPLRSHEISIASINMLNHFDHLDDTQTAAEPKPTQEEIAQKEEKLSIAIAELLRCPTLIGVQEVEKRVLLEQLATKLEEACDFRYEISHLESADVRGIDVALLSHAERVTLLDMTLMQTCTAVPTTVTDPTITCQLAEFPLFSRPPLRVLTEIDGHQVTFLVNHFKSKRGGEAETAVWRQTQATFINEWVGTQLSKNEQAHIIVMGDFNDYEASQTMQLLTANGRLNNPLLSLPNEERYSLSFGGVRQLIDSILLSPALMETAVGVTILHTNVDYGFGYAQDLSSEGRWWRSSDHDFPMLWLDLSRSNEGAPLHTLMPTAVDGVVEETAVSTPLPTPEPDDASQSRILLIGTIFMCTILLALWWWKRA